MSKRRTLEGALSPEERFMAGFPPAAEKPESATTELPTLPEVTTLQNLSSIARQSQSASLSEQENPTDSASESFQGDRTTSLNTRVTADIGKAFLHATLDRRMKGIEPSTKRNIVEEAMTTWLKKHGYLV